MAKSRGDEILQWPALRAGNRRSLPPCFPADGLGADPLSTGTLELGHALVAERAFIHLVSESVAITRQRRLVALLDQEPVVAALFLGSAAHAHQRPAPLEMPPVEEELELALGIALVGIAERLPGAVVPHHDGAGAILSGGDRALESAVRERVVLDMDRKAPVRGIEARAPRHRPTLQDAVHLQSEIVVQAPRRVFLDDETVAVAVAHLVRRRLRRPVEPALALVGREVSGLLGGARCPGQARLLSGARPPPIASDRPDRNRGGGC